MRGSVVIRSMRGSKENRRTNVLQHKSIIAIIWDRKRITAAAWDHQGCINNVAILVMRNGCQALLLRLLSVLGDVMDG